MLTGAVCISVYSSCTMHLPLILYGMLCWARELCSKVSTCAYLDSQGVQKQDLLCCCTVPLQIISQSHAIRIR